MKNQDLNSSKLNESTISNYSNASVSVSQSINQYPIIRCENCLEIPKISLDLNSQTVHINCEKACQNKAIPCKEFFRNIGIYDKISLCQICKNSYLSQEYYLCKDCQNLIICQRCFELHGLSKEISSHRIVNIKIDSTCKKHYSKYESYCPKCKENKCTYCLAEHEESHEKDEIVLNKYMFRKNTLENFILKIKNISKTRNNFVKKVDSIMIELAKRIELLQIYKEKFIKLLHIKKNSFY